MQMTINLNTPRLRGIKAYCKLVERIKKCKKAGEEIKLEYLEEELETIRYSLVALCCSYLPGDDSFKDLSNEIPEKIPSLQDDEEDEVPV